MPKAKRSYSLREEEELIEAFRKYPVIYDKTVSGHKDQVVVENAWKAITDQLEFLKNGRYLALVLSSSRKNSIKK